MEGHALAQQVNVDLLAHVLFHALCHQLEAKIAHELEQAAADIHRRNEQSNIEQSFQVGVSRGDDIEGVAYAHLGHGHEGSIAKRAQGGR